MRKLRVLASCLLLALLLAACGEKPEAVPGTQIRMDFTRSDGFYSAPFPSLDLQDEAGYLDLSAFPNPDDIPLVRDSIALGEVALNGWSINAGVFFQTTAPLDPTSLPDVFASVTEESPIWLIDVTPGSPGGTAAWAQGVQTRNAQRTMTLSIAHQNS